MDNLNMKTTLLSLSTAVLLTLAGCSSGGGGNGGSSTPPVGGGGGSSKAAPVKSATLSGTTGLSSAGSSSVAGAPSRVTALPALPSATSEGTATLVVDSNGDELFGGDDLTYSTPIIGGAFSFDSVGLNADTNVTKAYLTVTVDGKTPYTEIVNLSDGDTFSVLAKTSSKPILTEVFNIASLTQSARETSFLRFGIKNGGSGLESFSKLMSLSEFKAMAANNLTLKEGEVSSSIIPTANLPKGLKSLTVNMQSYSSSNADDFAAFPGSLSGFGKNEGVIKSQAATGTARVQLESAGFDLMQLTDENGNTVDLDNSPANASKLRTFAAGATCNGMLWTRHLYSNEVAIIKKWPDESNATGYQVPIWSNDNASGAWSYIGLATIPDINASYPQFTMCVDKKWQGWLNCDSPLATSRPQQICVSAQDQFGKMLGSVSINGKKGGQYSYGYTRSYGDSKGLTTIAVKDANISGWKYTYSASMTGWSKIDIDSSLIVPNRANQDCDYDINLTINNPYTTIAHIKVYDINDTAKAKPLNNKYVRLYNSDYSDYYSKGAYTRNGEATFEIKPDVVYKATYASGETYIKANGVVEQNETNDTTREVYADLQDVNKAPRVNVGIYNSYNVSSETKELKFYVSARDANRDPLTFDGLFFDTKQLTEGTHYTVTSTNQYNGYYYMRGVLKLDSGLESLLAASTASYKLSAKVSDSGKLATENSNSFRVFQNQTPRISTLYIIDDSGKYYYPSSRNIPEGNFTFKAYTYDRERDTRDVFIKIDNNAEQNLTDTLKVTMTKGDHNITVRVQENATSDRKQASKTYSNIHFGNHAPTINYAYVNDSFVNKDENITLTATVYDSDHDDFNVTATANGQEYNLTKAYRYGNTYKSGKIEVNASTTFSIKAYDGQDYSQEKNISVTLNTAPKFTNKTTLADKATFTDTTERFVCNAIDPDGTYVSYQWFINGTPQSSYSSYYNSSLSKKFTAGDYNVSCKASDRDGASVYKNANISVTVNQAPVFDTNLTNVSVIQGRTQSFTCAAHDPEARGALSFSWSKTLAANRAQALVAYETNSSTQAYTFDTLGTYAVSCTARDVDGKTATSTATVIVAANLAPVFSKKLNSSSVDQNTHVDFECVASDPEKTTIAYTWTQNGTSVGTNATTYGADYNTSGVYTIACTATDGDGKSATSSATLTVGVINKPPVIDGNQYHNFVEVDGGKTLTGTIAFHDPDGTATIAVDTQQGYSDTTGFSINATTGAYTYDASSYANLAEGQSKHAWISLVVTDNLGAKAYTSLEVTVKGVYVAPIPTTASTFTLPYGGYSIEANSDINGKGPGLRINYTNFNPDTNLTEFTESALLAGSSTLIPLTNTDTRHVLSGSYWSLINTTTEPFTLNSAKNLIFIPSENLGVIKVSSEDVSAKERYIAAIDKNVTFSSGAKIDTIQARHRIARYVLENEVNWGNQTYDSLESFMNQASQYGWFTGDKNGGVSFNLDTNITTLEVNQTGTLKEVSASTTGTPTILSANVGTWKYERIDSNEYHYSTPVYALTINITSGNHMHDKNRFFTLYNTKVYSGTAEQAEDTFYDMKNGFYNAVAKDDILNAAKAVSPTPAPTVSNNNPVVGSWVYGDNLDITLVLVDNSHYFFAQGVVGTGGVAGGVETGTYSISDDNLTLSNFVADINTSAGDTAVGSTLTYSPINDTLSVGTITLVRQQDKNSPWIGGYVIPQTDGNVSALLLAKNGKYMIADLAFSAPSQRIEEATKGAYANAFEMGKYTINGLTSNSELNVTFDANSTLDFNGVAGFDSNVTLLLDVTKYPTVISVNPNFVLLRIQPNGPFTADGNSSIPNLSSMVGRTVYYINQDGTPAQMTYEANGTITGLDYAYYYDTNYTIGDNNISMTAPDGNYTFVYAGTSSNGRGIDVSVYMGSKSIGSVTLYMTQLDRDVAFMSSYFPNQTRYSPNAGKTSGLNSYMTFTASATDIHLGDVKAMDDGGPWLNNAKYAISGNQLTITGTDTNTSANVTISVMYSKTLMHHGVEFDQTINGVYQGKAALYSNTKDRDAADAVVAP